MVSSGTHGVPAESGWGRCDGAAADLLWMTRSCASEAPSNPFLTSGVGAAVVEIENHERRRVGRRATGEAVLRCHRPEATCGRALPPGRPTSGGNSRGE